jgi:hypothetical protein
MKRHYLHLTAYSCDKCRGPVISGSIGVRENEISRETDIREAGAICLSCGHRQSKATEPAFARHFAPVEWEPMNAMDTGHIKAAFVETFNRAELH